MKQLSFSILLLAFFITPVFGQKYFTKSGKINFDATSSGSPEKIEGISNTVTCVVDSKTGSIQFAALMKGFEFERALMQEHFNENYVESDKFPRAEFRGQITNNDKVSYSKDGTYAVTVKGKLTLHGETRDVETEGKLTVKGEKISAAAEFSVQVSDFKISIPGIVTDKVSKTARIVVACSLDPLKG